MKITNKYLLALPEYLLIAGVIFYWYATNLLINPLAITLIVILILQIIFKNKIVGIIIPSILVLVSIYMLLAVISEFNEFPVFDKDASLLLLVGFSYFISIGVISGFMLYKTLLVQDKYSQ